MTMSFIENLLCDYADSLDVIGLHHKELMHCHGWRTAIAEEVTASMAAELVRMATELTSHEFVQALAATTEPTLEIPSELGGFYRSAS